MGFKDFSKNPLQGDVWIYRTFLVGATVAKQNTQRRKPCLLSSERGKQRKFVVGFSEAEVAVP